MVEIETRARKWGDSIAVIIPREVVHEENIKQNDFLHIAIQKEYDLTDLFGKLKIKKTAQQLKDESRKGWE
ncbi:hypothetical protein HY498_02290 [Candidatus Woesearchaeota archaeon]|nr:hypothetical protein [Candidatus Woesearchaeota archaeon]